MKQKIKLIIFGFSIVVCTVKFAKAQWINQSATNTFNQPDYLTYSDIESVGIGDFAQAMAWGIGTQPRSAFHIGTNFYFGPNASPSYTNLGEVFRTTCPADISTFWRMERQAGESSFQEYGMLYTLGGVEESELFPGMPQDYGIHFYMQSSFADEDRGAFGDIRFNTGSLIISYPPGISTPRMRVMGNNGFVGVGDYRTFTPANLEHLHIQYTVGYGDPSNVYEQFTNSMTNATGNDGFLVGIAYDGVNMNAELRQQEVAPITFHTRTANGSNPMYERMRIDERAQEIFGGGSTTQATGVTISRGPILYGTGAGNVFSNPIATFNIGINSNFNNTNWAGNRPWMDVGTFNNFSSDNMYIGLKDEGPDLLGGSEREMDAVVNWGDNFDGAHTNTESIQNLRFIFTASGIPANTYANGPHESFNGLEIARMCSNGNMGIGDFYNNGPAASVIEPFAKLEILDAKDITGSYPTLSLARPHLRLTFTRAGLTPAAGIWTDFRTTSLGDLLIHPFGVVSSTDANPSERKVGINIATPFIPGNTLEITSSADVTISPRPAGLRFTRLTSNLPVTPVIPNPFIATYGSPCMLSVDGNGDVILVKDEGGDGDIKECSTGGISTTNINYITKITGNKEICNSAIYEDNFANVGIGTTSPNSKLHVVWSHNYPVTYGQIIDATNSSTSASSATGLWIQSKINPGTTGTSYGVISEPIGGTTLMGYRAKISNTYLTPSSNYGYYTDITDNSNSTQSSTNYGYRADMSINNNTSSTNYGFYTEMGTGSGGPYYNGTSMGARIVTYNAETNFGVLAEALSTTTSLSNTSTYIGVYGEAGQSGCSSCDPHNTFGGLFQANGGTNLNYGVFAAGGTVCAGSPPSTSTCTDAAAFFTGDVGVTGTVFHTSDAFLKDNIQPIINAPAIINQLNPVHYNFRTQDYPSMHLQGGDQFGLIADSLKLVCPDLVKGFIQPAIKDSSGNIIYPDISFKAINYTGLIPILIADLKVLHQQITDLQTQLNNCCGAPRPLAPSQDNNEKTGAIDVKLTNGENSAILYQNEPNPYHSATIIRFFIPENVRDVKITFQDATGKTLKEVPVNETGQGSINIDGSELISGTYTYSLVVSGKVIDTKKMVKVE